MIRPNLDVEFAILSAGVKKYQVAEQLGIADANFSRKMRKELSKEEKSRIFSIINELGNGGGSNGRSKNDCVRVG